MKKAEGIGVWNGGKGMADHYRIVMEVSEDNESENSFKEENFLLKFVNHKKI